MEQKGDARMPDHEELDEFVTKQIDGDQDPEEGDEDERSDQ